MSLEKAMTQTTLTADTVDDQFCSEWLKDQIKHLFAQLEQTQKEGDFLRSELAKALMDLRKLQSPDTSINVPADCHPDRPANWHGKCSKCVRALSNSTASVLDRYRDKYPEPEHDWRFRAGRMAEEIVELREQTEGDNHAE